MKIDDAVRLMEPPRYTRRMAAKATGKDMDTLRRWKRQGVFVPSEQRTFGQLVVDLYSQDDIAAMKKISSKPGPKTKA